MKHNIVIFVVIGIVLICIGCSQDSPNQPQLGQAEEGNILAKATTTPVNGIAFVESEPFTWSRRYITPGDNTEHIRDWPVTLIFPEDGNENGFVGQGLFIQNSDWTLPDYNGHASGPFTAELTWQGQAGTFSGQFAANIQGAFISANFVCQGSGAFEGLKWHAMIEGYLQGPYNYSGYVLESQGE